MTSRSKRKLSLYKADLWRVFSLYIRHRDKGRCITCGRLFPITGGGYQAGHYIARNSGGLALYFDERNVNGQCAGCNMREGEKDLYAFALVKKYGEGILEELNQMRSISMKMTRDDYIEKIKYYKEKLEEMNV